MEDIVVMSSRRAYEYRLDDIRLTLLSNRGVLQHIREPFAFELAGINQPMETFGPVPNTFPPGLVFDYGVTLFPPGEATPVRFLHVEQTRVVIDVAGPSEAIDVAFDRLNELTSGIRTADGTPALGVPLRAFDFSEIRFRTGARLEAAFRDDLFTAATEALAPPVERADTILVPSLLIRLARSDKEYRGAATPAYETWSLDLRAGIKPDELVFYSGAPLASGPHIAFLHKVESLISSDPGS